eukprot:1812951-Rhodomonas_salina.5
MPRQLIQERMVLTCRMVLPAVRLSSLTMLLSSRNNHLQTHSITVRLLTHRLVPTTFTSDKVPEYSEEYEFRFKGLGWVKLWVDEELLIWAMLPIFTDDGKQLHEFKASKYLRAGRSYQIEMAVDHNRK